VKGHKLHTRAWPAILAVLVLIAAHAAFLGLAFRGHLSVTLVVVLLGVLALKYGWWRARR